ncbi:MAG: hypothetical protein JWN34_3930, partial [Bryobacterales bacterium]|nr:hypothetical protein [Bryobacterales bacterium]
QNGNAVAASRAIEILYSRTVYEVEVFGMAGPTELLSGL